MTIFHHIGNFTRTYPALLTGLLIGGALIAAVEQSIVPAAIQAVCAIAVACTIKRGQGRKG